MPNLIETTWQPREMHEIAIERLRAAGLRPTWMRLTLIDLFEQNAGATFSCEEVYRLLLQAELDVCLSSTYSNIRRLVRAGVLVRGASKSKVRICATFGLPERA